MEKNEGCSSPLQTNRKTQEQSLQRPAACFYIQFPGNDFYHAIYVHDRTIRELRDQISRKARVQARCIFNRRGAGSNMLAGDGFVRQIPNRQVMAAEFLNPLNVDRETDVLLTIKDDFAC
ncbi:hypothetical protein BJX66DRAFT_318655 [Aspergillus keveii]|uniref:Uncharacterized protein n=1 Tax=Aspergillus keveii TaxID=714993 RepID=A0ABR4FJE6_9EURO